MVLREPSVVAMDKNTGKLLKVGTEAQAMLGRTPGNIVAMVCIKKTAASGGRLQVFSTGRSTGPSLSGQSPLA